MTRSVMYDSMRAQHRCAAHCIRSAHFALVVAHQHERRLDDVCERPKLLVPEHGFKQGEDTLRSGRAGCEGEDDLGRNLTKFEEIEQNIAWRNQEITKKSIEEIWPP
jgi:pyruvate/2-oxoacid:ferredoxin oxidoreductase alpha subunit